VRLDSNVEMFIGRRGATGGGIVRYMYGRFLGEAASITGEPRPTGMGTELAGIASRWEETAGAFAQAAQADHPSGLLGVATRKPYSRAWFARPGAQAAFRAARIARRPEGLSAG
jgi:hypothetical protein